MRRHKFDFNPRPTFFQKKVYTAICQVPRGRVTTYKILAGWIKCGSCRAVGQALRMNPFAPKIPCHRVIASDLSPGGFNGHATGKAIEHKLKLLRCEGILFRNGKLAEPELIYKFPQEADKEI